MPRVNYEIDARAETVIILKAPNANFAPWSLAEVGGHTTVIDREATANKATFVDADQEASQAAIIANDASESNLTETEGDEICYYVSRRYLVSTAPTFERMLPGTNWKEGIPNENDGLYHAPAEGWDSEALLCILRVLHLRNSQLTPTIHSEALHALVTRPAVTK